MPNLWTKAAQKLGEAFNGPRTKDTEYDSKIEEMKIVERGVHSLRMCFQNFLSDSVSIRTICRDVISSIKVVYDKKSPYNVISSEISEAHSEMEKYFEDFYSNLVKLNSRTSEWAVLFAQVKEKMEKRDKCRKTYDHYDEKMEKIYKNKREKLKKNQIETTKDIEYLQRNESKFKKSTEEYVKLSEEVFEMIQNILDKRYDLINPVLADFLEYERLFFANANNVLRKFDGIGSSFKAISNKVVKLPITYDPCKYIRGGEIIKKEKVIDPLKHTQVQGQMQGQQQMQAQNENDKIKSKVKTSILSNKIDEESKFGKSQNESIEINNNNNFHNDHNIHSNNQNNNNFQHRPSDVLYQEFSGISDNFSANNSNFQRNSSSINRRSISTSNVANIPTAGNLNNSNYINESAGYFKPNNIENNNNNVNNNLNDFNNDFNDFDFSDKQRWSQDNFNNVNYNQNENSARRNTQSNNKRESSSNQGFSQQQYNQPQYNPQQYNNQQFDPQPYNPQQYNNQNNINQNNFSNTNFSKNFDFDNIFNVNNSNSNYPFNMNSGTLINAPSSLPSNVVNGVSQYTNTINKVNSISNSIPNFKLNVPGNTNLSTNSNSNSSNLNNNPKKTPDDIFKDLF